MGMTRQRAAQLAWGSLAVSAIFAVAALILTALMGPPSANAPVTDAPLARPGVGVVLTSLVAYLVFCAVGALIASRRPENPLAWLLCGFGLISTANAFLSQYAEWGIFFHPGSLPGAELAYWFGQVVWLPTLGLSSALIFLLFPTGRVPSPRWRPVLWAIAAGCAAGTLGGAVLPTLYGIGSIANPVYAAPFDLGDWLVGIGFVVVMLGVAASVVSLFIRFRRSVGDERQQLKWFIYAALATVVLVLPTWIVATPSPTLLVLAAIGAPLIPAAVGIAILKYRLYEIDVVINKTVVYASLAAFITAVYVAIVVGIGSLVGQGDRPNVALSILATAIVAVAAQPVRARMQRVANRLVYGERASPYEVLTQLAERVGGEYATEDVLPRTARVIAEGTAAVRADVWLRFGEELRLVARWPSGDEDAVVPVPLNGDRGNVAIGDADRSVPIFHQGELLGAIAVTKPPTEPFTPAEDKLLDDLASQAGLVLRNVGLTAELQARLDELSGQAVALRSSRQRIVAAQDAERKRLERNIHDGAQQHLVALAVKLRLAKTLVRTDAPKAAAMLAELRGETSEALETLRDLARGIYPPVLEEQGLAAALHAQVYRSGMRVTIEADGLRRHPIETEAAIYFCCLEALQNAAKYAEASTVVVQLREDGDELAFSITDDGRGFDPNTVARGSGLQNMVDRVVALGGDVEVRSQPGHGTAVSGTVPSITLEIAR
jgi:signal transduction histidine kinase